ncbi:hypothetical protein TWF225_010964 [Orbilia oligospora]|uniref:Uncharacterized protein n=1 Tax=Orbilia oligospora TaxID=2813651 RepID=A0A7C8PR12_ORBOL|nr:hypothetical protein TWF751_005340 [Orbilia oligospora]KAF3193119.1 hypothetical protein TWF225_010964 [Orbilia oligospora]KAF3271579.1 hypothetical protein TWF128_000154 [Orbilia oligospora]KAF3295074.1 hypothetical protein TWF132_002398 [Orbilia oligospora]TGJ72653.1 hypothetical protein EYR41_004530 [Orbilia oligospora]
MYRRKIFSTIVSAGLLLIPSVYGQFPGKNTNGEGSGTGINLEEATETRESSPAQTTIATSTSDNCNRPVQLIGLSNDGPYIPVMIDGTGPYNLAVSFEEEGTYIFSQKFCREALKINGEPCFYTASPSELGTDDEEHTVNTGEGGFEFEYITQPTEAKIGQENNSVVFERYPIRVVDDVDSRSLRRLRARFRSRGVYGIIGLKNNGDFIRRLSSACGQSGWGIHLQPGSFFSFGGIDSQASAIGTNNTDVVVDLVGRYVGEIQPVTTGFSSSPNSGFTRDIRIDPMAPYNVVPSDISDAVEGGFAAGSSADITIAGVTFNIPWTGLVYAGAIITSPEATMILGAPFLQYIYAATLPGGRQNVVFARDSGASTAEFKPFSEILTTLPTKTQPGNSQSSSSNSPDRKVENSGDDDVNEPMASNPMMVKSSNNIGAIVGGVVGGVVGLLIILVAACCFYRRRKLMKGNSPRGVEKEYEADFDAEIGHHDGFLPQFKESGYATLPTPPPPPGQEARPQIPSLILGSPINVQYDSQTEYTPTLHPYHDESPSRSLNVTPLPPPSQTPILTIPPVPERRLSITPSLSIEPPSPLSRNVSAASRQNFPSISQLQRNRSNVRAVPEEDDYDVVSMASGPIYNPILASQEASSSAPRLPFTHRPESGGAMGMTDRGAGL